MDEDSNESLREAIYWLLIGVAIVYGLIGMSSLWSRHQSETARVVGRVWNKETGYESNGRGGTVTYLIDYGFEPTKDPTHRSARDGKTRVTQAEWDRISVGAPVRVRFDPSNPEVNELDLPWLTNGGYLFALLFGLLLGGVQTVRTYRGRARDRKVEPEGP